MILRIGHSPFDDSIFYKEARSLLRTGKGTSIKRTETFCNMDAQADNTPTAYGGVVYKFGRNYEFKA